MILSIVIPVFNELRTLPEILKKIEAVDFGMEKEIVIVDDFSTDGTREYLNSQISQISPISPKIILQPKNLGKGSAVRVGFKNATGDILIIQDADLEYDPKEIREVISPIVNGNADAVFSSRFLGDRPHRVLYFWHYLGNKTITFFTNIFANINLTDIESCYKAFKKEALENINLKENRFGFEVEITIKIARKKLKIFEVGVSYDGRTYEEGKKIKFKDGFEALWCILKYGCNLDRFF
jgi:glycosyltransferase involved in cell wall biosynthesis